MSSSSSSSKIKRAKTEKNSVVAATPVSPNRPKKTGALDKFFQKEWPHLRDEQTAREAQIVRARRLLDAVTTRAPAENNVADLIFERLEGFGNDGYYSDVLVIAFKEVLSDNSVQSRPNATGGGGGGAFLAWYQRLTADITWEKSDGTLWCEDDDWVVFISLAQFLTANERIEACGRELLDALKSLGDGGDGDDSSDNDEEPDFEALAYKFLTQLDADPFIGMNLI